VALRRQRQMCIRDRPNTAVTIREVGASVAKHLQL
jgi:hypothetical protein